MKISRPTDFTDARITILGVWASRGQLMGDVGCSMMRASRPHSQALIIVTPLSDTPDDANLAPQLVQYLANHWFGAIQ